ncbi:MAG: NUDIX domain-containing protein [Parcubacteria group bacterium]|jgi:8-oxo-dGTP pyrophosphatase MutT (NUDIX family)
MPNIDLKKIEKDKHRIVPASYLVLMRDNKVLMLKRFNTGFYDGYYSVVAGHKESLETFKQCLAREAKEEANIMLNTKDMDVIHVMNRYESDDPFELRDRIDVFLAVKKWKGQIKNLEPSKCDDLKWFSLDKLPANTIPSIKHALKSINKGIFYSEFGW